MTTAKPFSNNGKTVAKNFTRNPFVFLGRIAQLLLLCVIFFLPWQTRLIINQGELNHDPWEYGTSSFYAVDILVILFVLCVVGMLASHAWRARLTFPHILMGFLVVIAFFSALFAQEKDVALFWCWKLAEGVILAYCISHVRWQQEWRAKQMDHWAYWTLIAAGLLQSLLAFVQFTTQEVIGSSWFGIAWQHPETLGVQVVDSTLGRILRAYGAFPHPNILGGFLVACTLVCFATYLRSVHHRAMAARFLAAISLAILSVGVWTTFSRQAWAALALGLAIFAWRIFITEKEFPKAYCMGALIFLVPFVTFSLLFPQFMSTRLGAEARLEEKSLNERQIYFQESVEVLRTEWIMGVGMGNYTAYIHKQDARQKKEQPGFAYQPVHNIYLLIWNELGLFGLLTWLFFLVSLVQKHRTAPDNSVWRIALISLLLIGLVDHYLWTLHAGILLFWLIVGFSLRHTETENSPS